MSEKDRRSVKEKMWAKLVCQVEALMLNEDISKRMGESLLSMIGCLIHL